MKRIVRSLLGILLLVAVVFGLSINAYASIQTRSHIIDNDDEQGYTNVRDGFDTWFQANTLYYQDGRRQVCNSNNNLYEYIFPQITSLRPMWIQISAYLYHASFTDPVAAYGANCADERFIRIAGSINQDLAAAGWNVIGSVELNTPGWISMGQSGYFTWMALVEASQNNPGKYCGADALKVVVAYE